MVDEEYLQALQHVLDHGEERCTRNSDTISSFGVTMKFDIRREFTLITSKSMFGKEYWEN
jgi:thymidylate synthase